MDWNESEWYAEKYTEHEGHLHRLRNLVAVRETRYQRIEILDTAAFGRCLLLDGKMQSSEADEFLYHELLVHPALLTHPRPRRVLIIGGGEGATAREVLRDPGVSEVRMLEIDPEVVRLAKLHLASWHRGAFSDPRLRLSIEDGRRHVEETPARYDIILVDASDPVAEGVSCPLFSRQFYAAARRCLSESGLLAVQAGSSSILTGHVLAAVFRTLQRVFPVVRAYEVGVPSFAVPWGFCVASCGPDPRALPAGEIHRRLQDRGLQGLRAYDAETHAGIFHLHKALRDLLRAPGPLIEDAQPVTTTG